MEAEEAGSSGLAMLVSWFCISCKTSLPSVVKSNVAFLDTGGSSRLAVHTIVFSATPARKIPTAYPLPCWWNPKANRPEGDSQGKFEPVPSYSQSGGCCIRDGVPFERSDDLLHEEVPFYSSIVVSLNEMGDVLPWVAIPIKLLKLRRLIPDWHPHVVDSLCIRLRVHESVLRWSSVLGPDCACYHVLQLLDRQGSRGDGLVLFVFISTEGGCIWMLVDIILLKSFVCVINVT
ncbi:hypothetical protein RJ640_003767 [Escallonia rubra]|uniref:Uncharacterized protein n=1 Tax=Escallonia rubra TaxID=112253 RepID=A0AA88QK13_9ASTE|nr:hypothetical protein RJ640_003767 [Escallonia rubra]